MEVGLELQQQWQTQSKQVEWKEYYIYEHRKRRALEKRLDHAKKELALYKKELLAIDEKEATGKVPMRDREAAERVEYRKKVAEAQKNFELMEHKVKEVEEDILLGHAERVASVKQAQECLDAAQKVLKARQSHVLEFAISRRDMV